MSISITSTITDGQKKQYRRFMKDTFRKTAQVVFASASSDKDSFQRLLERGDEYQTAILEVAVAKARELSLTNQFANEEVSSNYAYPKEYRGPHPIEGQIAALATALDLVPADALAYATHLPAFESFVPADALAWTGWFAVPSLAALTTIAEKHFPEVEDMAERYCRAILFVFGKLAATRPFQNWREGQITAEQLRMTARLVRAMEVLAETQKGDILIIAAQLGMRHRGRSTRCAREVFAANEVGLGSLMGASIALTHPERFVRWEELDMDLPGDEFSPDAGGQFVLAPVLDVFDAKLEFDPYDVGSAYEAFGSASFFLPQ